MKKALAVLVCAAWVLLLLAACGGQSPSSSGSLSPSAVAQEEAQLLGDAGEIASAVAQDVLQPVGSLRQKAVATGFVKKQEVLIFQVDIGTTGGADGFVAVEYSLGNAYMAKEALLEDAVFYRVDKKETSGFATYLLSSSKANVTDVEFLDGAADGGREGAQYAISAEWLQALRDATWADWQNKAKDSGNWCLEYCRSLLSFFADTGVPVPGAYTEAEALKDAIDKAGGAEDALVYEIACEVMDLDFAYYYEFIEIVAPE